MVAWWRRSGPAVAIIAVLILILAIDAASVVGALRARREAQLAAAQAVARRVEVEARTFEAALAVVRADLEVLAASAALDVASTTSRDPMSQRRERLARESVLLLFAAGHPVIDELRFEPSDGLAALRVVRGRAEPYVLDPEADWPQAPLETTRALAAGRLVVRAGGSGSPTVLGLDGATVLVAGPGSPPSRREESERVGGDIVAVEALTLVGWAEPDRWWLERRESRDALTERVEELAASSRLTLALHLALVPLTVGLGLIALRGVARSARLALDREMADQKRVLERQVWHHERLASVGRLAAGLAHEINNPLAGITTWMQLLEEDLAAGEIERASTSTGKVRQGLDRIRDVVRSTLAFADPGRGELDSVDLLGVVRETSDFVSTLVPQLDIEIEGAGAGRDTAVRGDRPALGQLVLNLLLNAAQAQEEQGRVVMTVESRGEAVALLVDDDGPGIAPDLLETLFEPFVSGRGSTGLGLSVCHGIVAAHSGTITGDNRAEGGARFVVVLPREGGARGVVQRDVVEGST